MSDLSPLSSSEVISARSRDLFCILKFEESTKPAFQSILSVCKKAELFIEVEIGERKKKKAFLVGFERSPKGARHASFALEDMRIAGLKYLLFANGRVQTNKFAMINMISCYAASLSCKNPKAHCSKVIEPFDSSHTSLTISFSEEKEPEPEQWLLPCQHLDGFLSLEQNDPVSPRDRLDAVAVQRNVNLCPNYTSEGLGPIQKISGTKKFW